MDTIKLLLISTLLSIIPGQLVRISLFGSATITISDIAALLLVSVFTVYSLLLKKSIKLAKNVFVPFIIFTSLALTSTIFATQNFSTSEIVVSLLFLVRFVLYFSIFVVVANTITKSDTTKWLNLFLTVCLIFSLIGFLGIILFPDLTSLAAYGWDPHQTRIVSTFLDPNFSGGLEIIAFAIATSLFLNSKKTIYLIVSLITFSTLILTFSRSSYLGLLVVIFTIGILKSPKILVAFLLALIVSFLAIPQVKSRVIGALTLDETSQARIESWQKALQIFSDNAAFGVGFNTYRFAQANYGFFSSDQPEGGHSGAGTDSSILLVAATTGIVGVISYLVFLLNVGKTFAKNLLGNPLSLGATASFLGLLVHSQFVNSLFFPQIMLCLFFLLGLAASHDN